MTETRSINALTTNCLITWKKCETKIGDIAQADTFIENHATVHMNKTQGGSSLEQEALLAFTVKGFDLLPPDRREALLKETIGVLQMTTQTDSELKTIAQNAGTTVHGTISWEENEQYHIYNLQLGQGVSYKSDPVTTIGHPLHLRLHSIKGDLERIKQEGHPLFYRAFETSQGLKSQGLLFCSKDEEKKGVLSNRIQRPYGTFQSKIHKNTTGFLETARMIGANNFTGIRHIPDINYLTMPKESHNPKIIVGSNGLRKSKNNIVDSEAKNSAPIHPDNPAYTLMNAAFNATGSTSNISCAGYEITTTITGAFVFEGHGERGERIANVCANRFCDIFSTILQKKLESIPRVEEKKADLPDPTTNIESTPSLVTIAISPSEDTNNSDLPPLYGPFLPPAIAASRRRTSIIISSPTSNTGKEAGFNFLWSPDMTGTPPSPSSPSLARMGAFAKPKPRTASLSLSPRAFSPGSRYTT